MALDNLNSKLQVTDADRTELTRYYKHYQEKLLQVTARNRSVLLRRIYNKHNFDVAQLEEFKEGTIQRITSKVLKNLRSVLGPSGSKPTPVSILLDSISSEDADSARSRLKSLSRNLARMEEETGQQAGYLGFPFLQGHVTPNFYVRGPLVLFPISLVRSKKETRRGWAIELAHKRPILNGALIASLKKKGNYDLPEDYEESFDEMIEDVANASDESEGYLFDRVHEWIKRIVPIDATKNCLETVPLYALNQEGLDKIERQSLHLVNYKIIGNFPQADDQIYKDYNYLISNAGRWPGVVGNLLGIDPDIHEAEHDNEPEWTDSNGSCNLDRVRDDQMNTVLKSDSSQDEIIVRSKSLDMLVVRGPPGTGKSQVIVNLIADALMSGKKILVVCQKRAALEVVQQRLEEVGLDRYVVFLAKEMDDRTMMYKQMHGIIMQEPSVGASVGAVGNISQKIDSCIEYLSKLGSALRKEYFEGATAHKIYAKANGNYRSVLNFSPADLGLTWQNLDEFIDEVRRLEAPFKKLEDRNHPWFGRKNFSKFGIAEANHLDGLLRDLLSMHPGCLLAESPSQQEQLERRFAEHRDLSASLEGVGLSGLGPEEANHLDGLLRDLLSMHPGCLLAESPSQQEQLERRFAEHRDLSASLEGVGLSGLGPEEANHLDDLLRDLLSMHPGCLLAESPLLQAQLGRCLSGYQRNRGLFKRSRRKEDSQRIREILDIAKLDEDFVDESIGPVKKGIRFWEKLSELPGYLDYDKRETLERKIEGRESALSAVREVEEYLKNHRLREAAFDEIRCILNVSEADRLTTDENFEMVKNGIQFWEKTSKLPRYLKDNERNALERKIEGRESALSAVREMRRIRDLYHRQHAAADEIRRILGMGDMDEAVAGETFERVMQGTKFWKKLSEILGYFDDEGQERLMQEMKHAGMVASVLRGMKESCNVDELQYFDTKKAEHENVLQIMEQARDRMDPDGDWSNMIREEVYFRWLTQIERENPVLRGYHVDEYQSKKRVLAELMEKKRQAVQEGVRYQIEGAIHPDMMMSSRSRKDKIWRDFAGELQRKRKVKPVRKVFESYAKQMFKVAPCWLASPESISKVFPMQRNLFDLAIVDEASQLAVERAIPFLYRSKRVVVAGDEKQLPPFDLFQVIEDDEDDDMPEERSLLDLARIRFRTFNLLWHYRSKYQDLINFSNQAFYDGMLNVAPSVDRDPESPPIRWVQCNGVWENNTNREEAKAVVKELKAVWKRGIGLTGVYPSVGIITFNEPQQDLVQDEVDRTLDTDPEFAEMYNTTRKSKRDSRLFVKNIENVQGDERDVIIFSIGYARDADGMFAQIFGSLNKKGGENRLNVAVTRARQEMVIACSINPNDIKPTSKNYGPRRLRQFLQYAKATASQDRDAQKAVLKEINPVMGKAARSRVQEFDSDFEVQVCRGLERRGYRVDTQVGGYSGYRIDLAVCHPDDPRRYVIGIECDGAMFHSAKSVKERDVMRQKFLESKGWNIERVWSRNWWKKPNSELDRIDAVIRGILDAPSSTETDL